MQNWRTIFLFFYFFVSGKKLRTFGMTQNSRPRIKGDNVFSLIFFWKKKNETKFLSVKKTSRDK